MTSGYWILILLVVLVGGIILWDCRRSRRLFCVPLLRAFRDREPQAIRPETAEDREAIWKVNRSAFDSDAEANLVDALRNGGFVEVSLVAEVDEHIVGQILFSRVTIITKVGMVDAVSLAPMAVLPDHQRQGIGSKLVLAGLEACRAKGDKIVVVLGHPEFYPRFGFSAKLAQPLESPFGGGEAWMAMELELGALDGVEGRVEYSPPFGAFE